MENSNPPEKSSIPSDLKEQPLMPGQISGTVDHSGTIRVTPQKKNNNPLERLKGLH